MQVWSHLICQNKQETEPNEAQSVYFKMLVSISLQTQQWKCKPLKPQENVYVNVRFPALLGLHLQA